MNKRAHLSPEFVDTIPATIEQGKIYISIDFATAIHSCACGCGMEVVTPFSPTDWKLVFDGVSISLSPSIGNWSFPCRSHYWIRQNQVHWAGDWTDEEINAGRANDRRSKEHHYGIGTLSSTSSKKTLKKPGFWKRWFGWLIN
ncbi:MULTISPECIES: DUF6527 family protein [Sphingomonadales]|jgi:hypothetical protein|uniref:DUF6527 family protein n=1 Tax=Sphingomonadales TaxID=204457 RepID=UPI001EFB9C11|nr:DUF6527 family protein [Croceicoccus hydrothermalis]